MTPKVGISIGDANGIGLEVIIKTLSHPKITNFCTPVIYGTTRVVRKHRELLGMRELKLNACTDGERIEAGRINVIDCWEEMVEIELGQVTADSGHFAMLSLERAVNDLQAGLIDTLVTAPIHKKAMKLAKFPYPGHTEYLTKTAGEHDSLMFMCYEGLRVGLVTNHTPLQRVPTLITKERILKKLRIMNETLRRDFGIERPVIAVLGLNPHASDEGAIGEEEGKVIRPAVLEAKKQGMIVTGPFAADGFFGSSNYRKYDGILAMYHDQGLIPFKTLSFGEGVNYTAGLPFVRTSPDHGTGFDIAGQGKADAGSFRKALFLSLDLIRNRQRHDEAHENPVAKRKVRKERR